MKMPIEALLLCAAVLMHKVATWVGSTRKRTASTAVVAHQEPTPRHTLSELDGPAIYPRPIGINGCLFVIATTPEKHDALCSRATLQMALAFACSKDKRPYSTAWEA